MYRYNCCYTIGLRLTSIAAAPLPRFQNSHYHCRLHGSLQTRLYTTSFRSLKPGTERVQALADISRSALCCHSNETRAPIANPPNSSQLEGTRAPTIPPSYTRVRAVESEFGEGGTDKHTDGRDQYAFRLGHTSSEM